MPVESAAGSRSATARRISPSDRRDSPSNFAFSPDPCPQCVPIRTCARLRTGLISQRASKGDSMATRVFAATVLFASFARAKAAGTRGYLGLELANLPPGETQVQGGVLVNRVLPGSAAQRAGFKAGEIVVAIDTTYVSDAQTAVGIVSSHRAGDTLSFVVIDRSQGFNQLKVSATLAASPPSGF